jgi:hypothetical protein
LPDHHELRWEGQVKCCCPEGYYTKYDKNFEEEFYGNNVNMQHCCNTESDADYYRLARTNPRVENIWYHTKFPFQTFKGKLRYHFCDFRDEQAWKRKPHRFYINKGREAEETQTTVEGIKGLFPFFSLRYTDISIDLKYDPMHILKNCCEGFLNILLGNRCNKSNLQSYISRCKINDWKQGSFPWLLKSEDKIRIDCMIECIVIPLGHAKFMDVKNICHLKYIKCSGYITIFTVLMPFILQGAYSIPKHYKSFFEMVADDLTDIIAVEIDPDKTEELFKRIKELLSLKEGLFPDSEARFIFHQLLHLRSSIENFGPIRHTWAMAGERSIRTVKKYCKTSYEQNSLDKYANFEAMQLQQTYKFTIENLQVEKSVQEKTNDITKISVEDESIVYDDRRLILKNRKEILKLEPWESNNLALALLEEILYCFNQDVKRAEENSQLYRLYRIYLDEKIDRQCDFYTFLKAIYNYRMGRNTRNNIVQKIAELDNRINSVLGMDKNIENVEELVKKVEEIEVYERAVVYGIKINSRGALFRETKKSNPIARRYGADQNYDVFLPLNEKNSLRENWKQGKNCWVKIRNGATKDFLYAQVNCYMKLNMGIFCQNLPENYFFANVTAWHSKDNKIYCKETMEGRKQIHMYDQNTSFVPVYNLFSTAVAYCAFGSSGNNTVKPIYHKNVKDKFCSSNENYFCDNNKADYLYMIDIYPERRCIKRSLNV